MRSKILSKLFSLLLTLTISFALNADDHISVMHQLDNYQIFDDSKTVSLTLKIENIGNDDLHRVKLFPSGNEFSPDELEKQFSVGFLPAQGQIIVNWTADTNRAADYFQSGMPLFFHIKAHQANGEEIEFPVYSRGAFDL